MQETESKQNRRWRPAQKKWGRLTRPAPMLPAVRRVLALTTALLLVVATVLALPFAALGADAQVRVSCQLDDSGFMMARQPVAVHPGLAAEYGYQYGSNVNPASDLTALDALVAAHTQMFGTDVADVTDALSLSYNSSMKNACWITGAFGTGAGVGFMVNGVAPHGAYGDATFYDGYNGGDAYTSDASNQAIIHAGDTVEFFAWQDDYFYTDTFSWLEQNGAKKEYIEAAPGASLILTAQGYATMRSSLVAADLARYTAPIEDSALVPVTIEEAGGLRVGYFGTALDVAGADGKLTLTVPTTLGTYYYSLIDDSGYAPLWSPWLEVKVTDTPQVPGGDGGNGGNGGETGGSGETTKTPGKNTEVQKPVTKPDAQKTKAASYRITLNARGGSLHGKKATKTVTAAKPYGTLPTPTKAGYVFAGWYTAKTGGVKVTAKTKVTKTAAHTLYAHWRRPQGRVVRCTAVALRRQATRTSARLAVLRRNTTVTVLGKRAGWYRVKVGARTGWVYGKYLALH